MSMTENEEIGQVVEYLTETDESIESKVSAVKNAVKTGSFEIEDVLSRYVDECVVAGVVYPMHETEIRKIREGYIEDTGKDVESVQRICHPKGIIEDKSDVTSEAISIYLDDESNKKEKILNLVQAAQRDGIEVSSEEVVRNLKEIDEGETDNPGEIDGDEVSEEDVANNIHSSDTVEVGDENNYTVETSSSVNIRKISWYVSGNEVGTGREITHSFSHPGEYNMSVEVVTESGGEDYVSTDVKVVESENIDISIIGDGEVEVGDTREFEVNFGVDESIVSNVEWFLNGIKSSTGTSFNTAFENGGTTYTIKVEVETSTGVSDSAEKDIDVITPTGVTTEIDAPEVVYKGDTVTFEGTVRTINTEIETVTCKIDGEDVKVSNSKEVGVEYEFNETGEYPVTLTAVNNEQSSDTAVATIECVANATVTFDEKHENAVHGETNMFTVDHDDELIGKWSVTGAKIVSKDDSEITVKYSDESVEKAVVQYEVENDIGDKTEIKQRVELKKPVIDVHIEAPESVMENEVVELSAENTRVENTSVESIQWELGDGSYIGSGETISHKFTAANRHKVNAIVETKFGRKSKGGVIVDVSPEPRISPVIVNLSGETTRDEFEFTASKSIVKNTNVAKYEWEVNGEDKTGEDVVFEFDAPGEYEVKLTIDTKANVSQQTVEEITVEQFTDVSVEVDGPSEVMVNETIDFIPRVDLANTSLKRCKWEVNGEVVAEKERLEHEFTEPGHYTVQTHVETVTGDEDKSEPKQVIVDTPDSIVTADISVSKFEDRVVAGVDTRVSSDPTVVENGEVKECEWVIDGDVLNDNSTFVNHTFSDYGEHTVELEVETFDGITDSTELTVYVSPTKENLPISEITEETGKAEVFGMAIDVFQDTDLSGEDKNRAVQTLIDEAQSVGIDVTGEEVEDYVVDFDDMSGSVVDVGEQEPIQELAVIEEELREERQQNEKGQSSNWTVSADEESDQEDEQKKLSSDVSFGVEDEDVDEEESDGSLEDFESEQGSAERSDDNVSNKDSLESDVEFGVEDTQNEIVDESTQNGNEEQINKLGESEQFKEHNESKSKKPGEKLKAEDNSERWVSDSYSEYEDPKAKYGFERTDTYVGVDLSGEESERAVETPPDSQLNDKFISVNEDYIDVSDRNKTVKISPETYDMDDSVLAMPNYSQDLLDFEYVLDEDDDLSPDDGNAAGIIATESGDYIAIGRVEGRDWSIHTSEKQRNIIKTYESHVLAGMDSHIQMLSIPTRFDIREHIDLVNDVLDEHSDDPDEMLMNIGRSIYPNWLENFMSQNDMKERQFYIVVTMSAKQLQEFKTANEDIMEQLADTPIIGDMVFERFTDDDDDDIEKYQILRELNKRMGRMKSNLRRMDVEVDRVTDRDEAMNVLYEYHQNMNPEKQVFPTGPVTGVKDEYEMAGLSITDLVAEYEPANDGEGE